MCPKQGGRVNPFLTVLFGRQGGEEGRSVAERVDGRADIVDVAGQRQLRRAGTATYIGLFFKDDYRTPISRQLRGRREAVGARADDHRAS